MGFFSNCLLGFILGVILSNAFTSAGRLAIVSCCICFIGGPLSLILGFPKIPVYILFGVAGMYVGFKLSALRVLAQMFQNPRKFFGN